MKNIHQVNFVLQQISTGKWPAATQGTFVPDGFSSSKAQSKKYWKALWPDRNTILFYGKIDYTVFWWADTAVYQKLASDDTINAVVGLIHPNERLNKESLKPDESYLRRFQGVLWDAFRVAAIPCNHIGGSLENPNSVIPLYKTFDPLPMFISVNRQAKLNQLSDELQATVINDIRNAIACGILNPNQKLNWGRKDAIELIVEKALSSVLESLFYKNSPQTKFHSLWRDARSDYYYVAQKDVWPKHLFVEIKTTEDINAPIIQATENLASNSESAVIQLRIIWPGNDNPTPHPLVAVAKEHMEDLGVCYKNIIID